MFRDTFDDGRGLVGICRVSRIVAIWNGSSLHHAGVAADLCTNDLGRSQTDTVCWEETAVIAEGGVGSHLAMLWTPREL